MMDLKGQCAIVTGGGHGIGRALAERLAKEGARVVVADLHEERGQKIAAQLGGLAVVCDVGDPSAVADLVRRAESAFGPVHVFCSNAGFGDQGPNLASTVAQVRSIVDANLLAHVWAAQQVIPGMVERGGGYLVQTISSAALITGPSGMGYTLTKHGALGFAEWLALTYMHLGIVVTCLCPNAVNTGMMGRNEDDESQSRRRDDAVSHNIGEIVEPEFVADMAIEGMREKRFLVLPHPRVGESFIRKANDYNAWLGGTNRRIRRMRGEEV
jgi:NAD(P)-dependent dehydrogenase (short-subunit alcohol dehydrogenase family)